MTDPGIFKFRLYVADDTLNSGQALVNLHALCNTHLSGKHHIELVDVFKEPDLALEDRVFMTPTLVKLAPGPVARIVGTLSQTKLVLQVLGLEELTV
ncbi:circadian clock KaiB family protein [Terracidiphilus gabretensis]|jgi:circadian clock protein KaiB|uniref:circadian clock KaiB family protein n=1 Tax=Terracidiphilus gabretensis TaxID=1577687 RepID=UPI00071BFB92|nr:circadian clock KaiB family protein [Terracidiphilus gabretensis]